VTSVKQSSASRERFSRNAASNFAGPTRAPNIARLFPLAPTHSFVGPRAVLHGCPNPLHGRPSPLPLPRLPCDAFLETSGSFSCSKLVSRSSRAGEWYEQQAIRFGSALLFAGTPRFTYCCPTFNATLLRAVYSRRIWQAVNGEARVREQARDDAAGLRTCPSSLRLR
jgi:hypothetical protein